MSHLNNIKIFTICAFNLRGVMLKKIHLYRELRRHFYDYYTTTSHQCQINISLFFFKVDKKEICLKEEN